MFESLKGKFYTSAVAGAVGVASLGASGTIKPRSNQKENVASTATTIPNPNPYKLGYDVSYPQNGMTLPKNASFAVVGINGGKANNFNPALQSEYKWAQTSTGDTKYPKTSFYLWAASPGLVYDGVTTADWPKSGTNVFGTCHHQSDKACSYQYGYNNGINDINYAENILKLKSLGNVFIDVEADYGPSSTGTWQHNNGANNLATIRGFADAVTATKNLPGIYSTTPQWNYTVGNLQYSPFTKVQEWVPGAGTIKGAAQECSDPFIFGAKVIRTQFHYTPPSPPNVLSPIDLDHAC